MKFTKYLDEDEPQAFKEEILNANMGQMKEKVQKVEKLFLSKKAYTSSQRTQIADKFQRVKNMLDELVRIL